MDCLEIFSGCGGLAKGLELAGFSHRQFIEFNHDACNSLRANFDPDRVFEGDIRDFDTKSLSSVDVIAGGPPCQPFSIAGKGRANSDQRDMFPQAVRMVSAYHPKAFIFENVKGLLRKNFQNYFRYIILQLTYPDESKKSETWEQHCARLESLSCKSYSGTTYDVQYRLLNAADYGVPQIRERVVIVGIRSDLHTKWQYPEPTHSKRPTLSLLGCLSPWVTVRDTLKDIPQPENGQNGYNDHLFIDGARSYPGHTGSDWNSPAKTIKAGGHGVPGGENMIRYPDGTVRYFTVYEAKLIQSFPRDYVITGAWGEAMRQIGNAVPVKLAEVLGRQLMKTLKRPL